MVSEFSFSKKSAFIELSPFIVVSATSPFLPSTQLK